jgi:hypothetical protein
MMMRAEQLPVTPPTTFILKIGTALLMMLAATFVLVHADIYFSHPLITQDLISELF